MRTNSLNPYYIGRYSMSGSNIKDTRHIVVVLILIILEDTL